MLNQGPNGNTAKIDSPAEIYFWARRQNSTYRVSIANLFMSIGLLITIIGLFAATALMWWPRIVSNTYFSEEVFGCQVVTALQTTANLLVLSLVASVVTAEDLETKLTNDLNEIESSLYGNVDQRSSMCRKKVEALIEK
jgi:hypothetical protein